MLWRHGILVICLPILVTGVSAETAVPAKVTKDAAIAIFRKQCPTGGAGFGPAFAFDAQLEGDHWHVHANFPSAHPEIDPNTRFKDLYLHVPEDGTPPKSQCYGVVVE